MKPKPHRRLPKARRHPVIHAQGVKPDLQRHRIKPGKPPSTTSLNSSLEIEESRQ